MTKPTTSLAPRLNGPTIFSFWPAVACVGLALLLLGNPTHADEVDVLYDGSQFKLWDTARTATRLAKEFSTAESPRFINGVLDAVSKEIRKETADSRDAGDAGDKEKACIAVLNRFLFIPCIPCIPAEKAAEAPRPTSPGGLAGRPLAYASVTIGTPKVSTFSPTP